MNRGLMAVAGAIRRRRRKSRFKLKNTPLQLSSATMAANSAENTVVGNVLNKLPPTDISLVNDAGGRFKLVDVQVRAGATPAAAGSYTIVIRQELASLGSQDSSIVITVA
jgi:hypothetical protein